MRRGVAYELRSRDVRFTTPEEFKFLRQQRNKLRLKKRARKVTKPQVKGPTRCHDQEEEFNKLYECANTLCARLGLSYFNKHRDKKDVPEYELVRPVAYHVKLISMGVMFHANFEAKPKDDPKAEVELFFAAMVRCDAFAYEILGCRIVAPGRSKSAAVKKYGCKLCYEVVHPKDWADFAYYWTPIVERTTNDAEIVHARMILK